MSNLKPIFAVALCSALVSSLIRPADAGLVGKLLQSLPGASQTQRVPGSSGPTGPTGPLLPSDTRQHSGATIVTAVSAATKGRHAASVTVTSVSAGHVTLAPDKGKAVTLSVDERTAESLRGMTGKRVVVATHPDGTTTVTPAFQALTGTVASVRGSLVTVRTPEGRLVQVVVPSRAPARLGLRMGSTVTALTTDGGATMTAYVLRPSLRRPIHYIGQVVSRSRTSLSLLTADGVTHTLACAACSTAALDGVLRRLNGAVYAEISSGGQILRVAPLPSATHLAGVVAGVEGSTAALLTGTGDLLMLNCSCSGERIGALLLTDGTAIAGTLDSSGDLVGASPYSSTTQAALTPAPATPTPLARCNNSVSQCPATGENPGAYPWLAAFAPSDYVASDCLLTSGTLINVRVQDARTELPVFHAQVRLTGAYGTTWLTSQDGALEFDGAPAGTYRVIASKPGFATAATKPFALRCRQGLVAEFSLTRLPRRVSETRIVEGRSRSQSVARRASSRCRFFSGASTATSRKRFVCGGR